MSTGYDDGERQSCRENRETLEKIAKGLIEREVLDATEIKMLVDGQESAAAEAAAAQDGRKRAAGDQAGAVSGQRRRTSRNGVRAVLSFSQWAAFGPPFLFDPLLNTADGCIPERVHGRRPSLHAFRSPSYGLPRYFQGPWNSHSIRKLLSVSGGSRGIGAATVRLLPPAGAKVVFNYQSAKAQADELVRELRRGELPSGAMRSFHSEGSRGTGLGGGCRLRTTRHPGCESRHLAPEDAPVDRMTDEQWHRTIAMNLDSVFGLVKHSVGQMKTQRSQTPPRLKAGSRGAAGESAAGHIVLVSSTAGQRGEAFHCDYAASKGALISMVKGLSTELARDGIRVNCVAPGWVATDMSAGSPKRSADTGQGVRDDSAGPRGNGRRNRRADLVSVHALRGLHHRRDFQRQRRRGAGRVGIWASFGRAARPPKTAKMVQCASNRDRPMRYFAALLLLLLLAGAGVQRRRAPNPRPARCSPPEKPGVGQHERLRKRAQGAGAARSSRSKHWAARPI